MAVANTLDQIQMAINAGDKNQARELLREEIKHNPTAEVWFLAAQVANRIDRRIKFLEKALVLDPTHTAARTALEELTDTKRIAEAEIAAVQPEATFFSEAVDMFLAYDWALESQSETLAVLTKPSGIRFWWAFIMICLIGLPGLLLALCYIPLSKVERVSLIFQPDGKLHVNDGRHVFITDDMMRVKSAVYAPAPGLRYKAVLLMYVVSNIVWMFL